MDASKIPDKVKSAYKLWKNGGIPTAAWWKIAGDRDKATAFEEALESGPSPRGPQFNSTPPEEPVRVRHSQDHDDGDDDPDEWLETPEDSPVPDIMPPVGALIITFIIAFMYYLIGELRFEGVVLFSIVFGFNLVGIIWLELLTLPRFSNRSDMAWEWGYWAMMMGISMAATIAILAVNYVPGPEYKFGWFFNDNIDSSSLLEISLGMLVVFNILIIHSMQGKKDVSKKILRSPWTIGSSLSMVTCWSMIEFPSHPWHEDLVLMLFGALIIGTSAWIYGRSQSAESTTILCYTLVPSAVGFTILRFTDELIQIGEDYDSLLLISFIGLPIVLNSASWALPKRKSDYTSQDLEGTRLGVVGPSAFILFLTIATIISLSFQSDTGIIPLLPLAFVYPIYSREHSLKMGGDVLKVHRILPRDPTKIKGFKKVGLKFSILGPTGTGKTSFATALWTLMREPENMNIWWSDEIDIKGEHQILTRDQTYLEALAKRGGFGIVDMIEARISGETCKEFREGNDKNIEPGSLPDFTGPFPFFAEAFGKSQKELEKYKRSIVEPDPNKRAFPNPTKLGKKLEMTVSFHADVEVISPSFLFTKSPFSRSRTGMPTEVELTIETWDIAGESFTAAVNHTREQIHKFGTRRQKKLKEEIADDWLDLHHEEAKKDEAEKAKTLFLESSHSFLIVDVDDLIRGDEKGIKEYLRLMQVMNRDGNSKTDSLTILLNKADNLLDKSAESPYLNDWDDMNNDEMAEEFLNKATNFAFDQLKGTGMAADAKFVCAFGGLIPLMEGSGKNIVPVKDENGKAVVIAPYPLIPVNVIEPLIEVILTSRLHSEEI